MCNIDFNNPKIVKNLTAKDLLMKMLERDQDDRITAKEALAHKFFINMPEIQTKFDTNF